MNKKKILAGSALALSMTLGAGMCTTIHADEANGTTVKGTQTVFQKYLVMDTEANVPNASFTFEITQGQPVKGDAAHFAIKSGIGKPTIGTADFKVGDPTFATKQPDDTVNLSDGQKYAKKDIKIDFSNITYNEPGVYRYLITENGNGQAIHNDATNTRLLDVYVTNQDGTLTVSAYVLHDGKDGDAAIENEKLTKEEKAIGYTNTYDTNNLTLSKTVTGNQGNHEQYFKFTVSINNAVKGTKYEVDLSNADAITEKTPVNEEEHTNPGLLTVGDNGSIQTDFWLRHNQSIVIKGIADDTAYNITEDNQSYNVSTLVTKGNSEGVKGSVNKVEDTDMQDDTVVAYTNDANGAVPTGLLVSVLPGAFVCLAGGIGITAIVLGTKRREREDE